MTAQIFKRLALLALLALPLAACGSDRVPEPIGIGTDVDELKKSPCACNEVPQNYQDWQQS
jgi:hypothetical protein